MGCRACCRLYCSGKAIVKHAAISLSFDASFDQRWFTRGGFKPNDCRRRAGWGGHAE